MKRNTLPDNTVVPSQNMRSLLSMEHFAIDTLISEEKPSHLYEWRFLFQKIVVVVFIQFLPSSQH